MKPKSDNTVFKRVDLLILGLIFVLALTFRLYKINAPLADWHSWRQADTAAVARNFVRHGFDLLHPKYDDVSNIQSGLYNPQGLRLVEFPLYNATFAFLYRYLPVVSLEMYGRLTSVFFSFVLISVLYLLVQREEGRLAALFSSLVFAVFPFFVFYSRVVLPEMTAISLMFCGIWFAYLYFHATEKSGSTKNVWFILSVIFAAASLLVKPTVIFYLLVVIYLCFKKYELSFIKKPAIYLYLALALLPLLLWRIWIAQFPEGVPLSEWLLFSVNTAKGLEPIFFRPAFFRWIFYERISSIIFGGFLTAFFVTGLLKKPHRSHFLFFVGISSLLYLFTFQGGNVQHDYYQTIILPTLAIFSGVGISFFLTDKKLFTSQIVVVPIVAIILAGAFLFSYYRVKDLYVYNTDLLNIAKTISSLTEPDSLVVTDTNGDTTLLYLADRRGFPAVTDDLGALKARGAAYFVTFNSSVATAVKQKFKLLVVDSDKLYLFKL